MRDACRPQFYLGEMFRFGYILGIKPSYLRQMKHRDDPEQFLVEVIHHWLQKHPEPNWFKLEHAMDKIVELHPRYSAPHTEVHSALQTLRKEYEGL